MPIDFTIAIARLLRDGSLRNRFAAAPDDVLREMDVAEEDRESLRQLSGDNLEYQATVLIRKRFDKARSFLPSTCACLQEEAFPLFLRYARSAWPREGSESWADAGAFLAFLQLHCPESISCSDQLRLAFLDGSRQWEFHWSWDLWIRGRLRSGVQILRRTDIGLFRESAIYLGL